MGTPRVVKRHLQKRPIQETLLFWHVIQEICTSDVHVATYCNTLQHTATHCNTEYRTAPTQRIATRCNTLQHTATHCNTLQHIVSYRTHSTNWLNVISSASKETYVSQKRTVKETYILSCVYPFNTIVPASPVVHVRFSVSKETYVSQKRTTTYTYIL